MFFRSVKYYLKTKPFIIRKIHFTSVPQFGITIKKVGLPVTNYFHEQFNCQLFSHYRLIYKMLQNS